ncbi:MAG: hypothetical protein JWP89_6035 [Schlesneria sp.]|nr:hypothetical protein [Schlesneria sp.]
MLPTALFVKRLVLVRLQVEVLSILDILSLANKINPAGSSSSQSHVAPTTYHEISHEHHDG